MLASGTILQNRYQIAQSLGGGGMGDVYLAHDLHLHNHPVVVKENRSGDPQLFYTEANILAALRHPNLPQVSDHFVEPANGLQYLVMDYVAGQTLEQIVQTRGPLSEQQALTWFYQILGAVRYMHVNRIIHRDIKPQNIIIAADGRAVLVDFGIAKVLQPGQATVTGARGFGSPGYAPPEQYTGGTDERSDVYALGATLYFALTGLIPPSVPERAYGTPLVPARSRNSNVSVNTEEVISKATALAWNQRYQNVPEMEHALRVHGSNDGVPISWVVLGAASAFVLLLVVFLVNGVMASFNKPTPTLVAFSTGTPTLTLTATATATPLATETSTPYAGEERNRDGAPMVFVPAGDFIMGSDSGFDDEKPVHTVYLDSFWIDKFEVTNALYEKCVDATRCQPPSPTTSSTRNSYYGNLLYDGYPVNFVSWNDAAAFCAWGGNRLPTEAQWEKAARGTDERNYPWGNTFDQNLVNSNEGRRRYTTAVGNFPSGASPYGAMDMAGNAWEWVADWYDSAYYTDSPRNNPEGPAVGDYKVVRGGSWADGLEFVRVSYRHYFAAPGQRFDSVGFRCAH